MSKNNRYRYTNLLGYIDILMNILMCFTVMFIFAFMLMKIADPVKNSDQKSNKSSSDSAILESKGKLIIHLHWPDKSDTDLDLWVRTDNPKNIVSFRSKDASNMWLDHDSQGASANRVYMADGSFKQSFGNDEVVQLKECTNTRIIVNIHNYHPSADTSEFPIPVTVDVIIPPSYNKILSRSLTMSGEKGEEVTAFSFNLNEDCSITDINQTDFIPFVYGKLEERLPGTRVPEPGQPIPGSTSN